MIQSRAIMQKKCTSSANSKNCFDIKNKNLIIYILKYFRGKSEKNNVNIMPSRAKCEKNGPIAPFNAIF